MILQDAEQNLNIQNERLKTRHRFGTDRFAVEIFTPPQGSKPTFMGATKERGRSPLQGQIIYAIGENEKISGVVAKLRAYVHTAIPSTKKEEVQSLSDKTFDKSSVTQRDELLYEKEMIIRDGSEVLSGGIYTFPYSFHLPFQSYDGSYLPPSCVISDLNTEVKIESSTTSKGAMAVKNAFQVGLEKSGAAHLAASEPAGDASKKRRISSWAEIRWLIKVTIQKQGILSINERMVVPFVFLSPPPSFLLKALTKRQALIQQLVQNPTAPDSSLAESFDTFSKSIIYLNSKELEELVEEPKKEVIVETPQGFLSSLFSKKKVEEPIKEDFEQWLFSLPTPSIFPTRTGPIPFSLRLEGSSSTSIPSTLPIVKLLEHVTIEGKSPSKAERSREISVGRLVSMDSNRSPYLRDGGNREWRGFLDVPLACCSSFNANLVKLDYSVVVYRTEGGMTLLSQPIKLLFPAPSTVQNSPKIVPTTYPPDSRLPPAPTKGHRQLQKQPQQYSRPVQQQAQSPTQSSHPQIPKSTSAQLPLLPSEESEEAPSLPSKDDLRTIQDHPNQPRAGLSARRSNLPPVPISKQAMLSQDIQDNLPPGSIPSTSIPAEIKTSGPSTSTFSSNASSSRQPLATSSTSFGENESGSAYSSNQGSLGEDDFGNIGEILPPSYWDVVDRESFIKFLLSHACESEHFSTQDFFAVADDLRSMFDFV